MALYQQVIKNVAFFKTPKYKSWNHESKFAKQNIVKGTLSHTYTALTPTAFTPYAVLMGTIKPAFFWLGNYISELS